MKHIYHFRILFLLLFSLVVTQVALSQTADLRIVGQPICSQNQYTATLQIRAANATSFSIGTSSILLSYSPLSLSFASYQQANFSPNNLCIANAASSWDNQAFDSSTPGTFNLTLTLLTNQFSCPTVTNSEWISIGTITFTIVNANLDPSITINSALTNFNSAPANDGINMIGKGTFSGLSIPSLFSTASLSATATACNPATNTYTLNGSVAVTNATEAGSLTVVTGAFSQTLAVAAGTSTIPFSFSGLPSAGGTPSVLVTVPGCASATTTYTAPTSCSVAPTPPCGVTLAALPGSCNPATNQFTLSGTLSLTNITQTTSVTITNGIQTVTGSIPVNSTTFSFSMAGLTSDGINRTVTATFSGTACSLASIQYTAPTSCSVAPPCVVNVSATPSGCTPATNTFSLSGVVQITNGPASGVLTVSSGGLSTTVAVSAGVSTYSYSLSGLPSNGITGQVTASISGTTCSPITQPFTAPASCSCTQAVITSAGAIRATCNGTTANNDASIQFTATGGTTYLVSGPGITQNTPISLPVGTVTITGLPNPATTASYTITVYTATSGTNCPAIQQTVTLQNVNCACPPAKCIPIVAERIR